MKSKYKTTDYRRMNPHDCPPLPFIKKEEVFYSETGDSFLVWNGKEFIKYIRESGK